MWLDAVLHRWNHCLPALKARGHLEAWAGEAARQNYFVRVVVSPAPQIGGCPVIPAAAESRSFQREGKKKKRERRRNLLGMPGGRSIPPGPRPHSEREPVCFCF